MEDNTPRITHSTMPDEPGLVLSGCWTAAQLAEQRVWLQIQSELAAGSGPAASGGAWDLRTVQRFDHTGAQVLWNAWGHQWPDQLLLLDGQRSMLERVAQYTVPLPVAKRITAWQLFLKLGAMVLLVMDHVRGLIRLVGQLLLDVLKLARAPAKGPWRDVSGHLYQIGATALPITALLGFLIGVVLAYLMSQQLRQFGADAFIVNILGISLIRELGPVLAAILIAGRSGSAITAQIGVMRVTEELDAMRVLGIAKGFRLVLPRAMAMAIAMARGNTRRKPWAMPMTRIASSSSVTRITPICAVMDEPERPAIRIAASIGPSSRIKAMPRMLTMKASAPNWRNCCDIR